MDKQQLICRALYDFNLTQLSIAAALEDMAALIENISNLSPQISGSLKRHLETVGRNCDRSCNAMYSLLNEKAEAD
ncbi:hypothetical protein ACLBW8_04065 [Pseudomonas sp. M5A4_2d]|uniref:hypothetical protein n=1 Tax=Pseudomonas sp. O39 TaxID=3379130 RepID=UPI001C853DF1|nr:hypothetical protein [Pseudomonas sp. ERGC3:01]QZC97093.1 hypothetical protein K2E96_15125 [Pseudomonas sp. ERGC3:05]